MAINKLYKKKDLLPQQITYNDELVVCNDMIANCLNEFFVSSITTIVNTISSPIHSNYNDRIERCAELMEFELPISMKNIKCVIHELRNKTFDDNVNGKVFRDLISNRNFMKCIANIVNDSLSKAIMPRNLKRSIVKPKPKTNIVISPESFRPINNLPLAEKVIERIVFNQLLCHITENNLLNECQYGFRKDHSTEAAVQDVVFDIINSFETRKCLILVSLDFRRAFETIDQHGQCEKLQIYGCSRHVVNWFRSYLNEREQIVNYNDSYSCSRKVSNGLPQGSKISNLLFIIFVNDISKHLKNVKVIMFADDTLLLIECENPDSGIEKLNDDLKIVSDWMKFNTMAMNIDKCCAMVVNASSDSDKDIIFDDSPIAKVNAIKYLGVFIDNELNMNCHYEMLLSKLNRNVGLLRRLSSKLDENSRRIFFKSIVLPVVDYCSSYLMLMDDVKLDRIQKVVNKAMRCVLSCDPLTPIDEMCRRIGIAKIKSRINLNSLLFVNKILLKGVPLRLRNKFVLNSEVRQRQLRNDSKFKLPLWICAVSRRSIYYATINMLNQIVIDDKQSFKMNCINFLKSEN
jgi:retron-type reverse transcriptase